MKNSAKLLHLAAQLDQMYRELEVIWQDPIIGSAASHDCGISLYSLRSASKRLTARAGLLQAEGK